MSQKSDTSLIQLVDLIGRASANPDSLNKVLAIVSKAIPLKTKRRVIMPDKNINKIFKIKRINYSVVAKITPDSDNMYNAEVLAVEGDSKTKVGDNLTISKRELELTGRPSSSYDE